MTSESTINKIKSEQPTLEQWLATRKEAASMIHPETCEVDWDYADVFDPYGVDPEQAIGQVGRAYFARAPGSDIWVWFGDLSEAIRDAIWEKHRSQLAFPAGLFKP